MSEVVINQDNLDQFYQFMYERHEIYNRRFVDKLPAPWTEDRVLLEYKFTNIYRELDYGTQFLLKEILGKHNGKITDPCNYRKFAEDSTYEEQEKDVIFNILIYKILNRIESYEAIGYQFIRDWNPDKLKEIFQYRKDNNLPIFTNAHMVSAYKPRTQGTQKHITVVDIFDEFHSNIDAIYDKIKNAPTYHDVFKTILATRGFGGFLAYEAMTDINYSDIVNFSENDWVNPGPGCMAGSQWLFPNAGQRVGKIEKRGNPKFPDGRILYPEGQITVDITWTECIWKLWREQLEHFSRLGLQMRFLYPDTPLTLRAIEHSLCEFSKYKRTVEGIGRPKMRFSAGVGERPYNPES